MANRLVAISRCYSCPHISAAEIWCTREQRALEPQRINTPIPEWCTLEKEGDHEAQVAELREDNAKLDRNAQEWKGQLTTALIDRDVARSENKRLLEQWGKMMAEYQANASLRAQLAEARAVLQAKVNEVGGRL